MVMERFVVVWLTVTFHRQNLSTDECAILGNSINNENAFSLSDADVGSQNSVIKSVTFA
jgi:hypothetical protein